MIAIVDAGFGNIASVRNALKAIGEKTVVVSRAEDICRAERLVLPGVGSFGAGMKMLREKGLEEPVKEFAESGKPFLGICLGMQLLFEESEESPNAKGLGVFKGRVERFKKGKVPQIGWNKVVPERKGILEEVYAYFVNSYYVVPENKSIEAAKTNYFGEFVSAIQKEKVIATQFHPEKSGEFGLDMLRRWIEC